MAGTPWNFILDDPKVLHDPDEKEIQAPLIQLNLPILFIKATFKLQTDGKKATLLWSEAALWHSKLPRHMGNSISQNVTSLHIAVLLQRVVQIYT